MKSLTAGAALGLALALAGCGDTAPPNAHAPAIKIANPGSDRLKALSPLNQRIGLMRAIRDNGKRCRRRRRGAYQQQHGDLAMWVALCARRRPLGGVHRAERRRPGPRLRETAQLGLPACRPVPPLPPTRPRRRARKLAPTRSRRRTRT